MSIRTQWCQLIGVLAFCQATLHAQVAGKGQLLFHSGFENGTRIVRGTGQEEALSGIDRSVTAPDDWDRFCSARNGYKAAGRFNLQYEGGDSTQRTARLIPDPVNPANTVLSFVISEPNVVKKDGGEPYKARVQATVNGASPGIQQYYQKVRMYFPSASMKALAMLPEDMHWFSLAEFWNNPAWGNNVDAPFRLTVGVDHLKGAGNPFTFHFTCDQFRVQYREDGKTVEKYVPTTIHRQLDSSFRIPSDQWITVEYFYQEGKASATENRPAGHFYMTVQPQGGRKLVLFNERTATIHPGATAPDGLSSIHPMKFYTSKQVAAHMKASGTPLEILWDDLEMYSGKVPDDPALQAALAKP